MRKVIALLTHAVGSDGHGAAAWEYFGSFGDDIFSDDADDRFETTDDPRPTAAAARTRLLTERRTLDRARRLRRRQT